MLDTGTVTLDVGGVALAVDAPAGWLAPLAERYAAYVVQAPPAWQVTLRWDPTPHDEDPGWIDHDGPLTRFHVRVYTGWLDLARRVATISAPSKERVFSAIERIVVYICMQTLPREHSGLLLHASGVVIRGAGHIFVGPSGAGKTTVARLATGYGQVVSDENVIARLDVDGPKLVSTPFWGFSTPQDLVVRDRIEAPLRAVYILAQTPGFERSRLSSGQAALALLDSEKVAVERPQSASAWLAVAERLVTRVPIYRLGFRPTTELWAFLGERS